MLSAQTHQKTIGGIVYEVIPLAAIVCMKLEARVARTLLSVIGESASLAGRDKSKPVTADDLIVIARMADGILEALDDATIDYLFGLFAPCSYALSGSTKLHLAETCDEHFRGRPVECLEWLRFCLEVNLGPLGARLRTMLSDVQPDGAIAAKEPKVSP